MVEEDVPVFGMDGWMWQRLCCVHQDNREMVTHSHQTPIKMSKQLNGKAFVKLENCSDLLAFKKEPIDGEGAPVFGMDGWMCPRCNYVSPRKFNVSQHMEYKHLSIRAFNCVMCFKQYKNNRDLVRHETRCQGEGIKMPGRPLGSIKT